MKRILILAGLLVSCAAAAQQAAYYQIDLVPTGKMLATDKPVLKGGAYVFRSYPSKTLMSLRPSQVKYVTPVTVDTSDPTYKVVPIGNLAMQGGSTQAGPTNANAVKPKSQGPELGEGFYSDLKMGQTSGARRRGDEGLRGRTRVRLPAVERIAELARRAADDARGDERRESADDVRDGRRHEAAVTVAPRGAPVLRLSAHRSSARPEGLDRRPDPALRASLPRREAPPLGYSRRLLAPRAQEPSVFTYAAAVRQ